MYRIKIIDREKVRLENDKTATIPISTINQAIYEIFSGSRPTYPIGDIILTKDNIDPGTLKEYIERLEEFYVDHILNLIGNVLTEINDDNTITINCFFDSNTTLDLASELKEWDGVKSVRIKNYGNKNKITLIPEETADISDLIIDLTNYLITHVIPISREKLTALVLLRTFMNEDEFSKLLEEGVLYLNFPENSHLTKFENSIREIIS